MDALTKTLRFNETFRVIRLPRATRGTYLLEGLGTRTTACPAGHMICAFSAGEVPAEVSDVVHGGGLLFSLSAPPSARF